MHRATIANDVPKRDVPTGHSPEPRIVAKIMNPNVGQLRFATGALPRRIVHAFDAFASIGEHPYRVLSSLRLNN